MDRELRRTRFREGQIHFPPFILRLCALLLAFAVVTQWGQGREIPFGGRSVISKAQGNPDGVHVADMDLDGDLDVVATSADLDKLAWYENDGSSPPCFVEHIITEDPDGPGGTEDGPLDGAFQVCVSDLDKDGDLDILASSLTTAGGGNIMWFESDGGASPTFTAYLIVLSRRGLDVAAADIDGDANVDIVYSSEIDSKLSWGKSDGGSPPTFTEQVITYSADRMYTIFPVDIDEDGDVDLVAPERDGDKVKWYENDGASPPLFTEHVIDPDAPGATAVHVADIDRDGDMDIAASIPFAYDEDRVRWYENEGGTPPTFAEHALSTEDRPWCVWATDFDGDGDVDFLESPFPYEENGISWFENDGGSPAAFTQRIVLPSSGHCFRFFVADLDGDGDKDVVAGSDVVDDLFWVENKTIHRSAAFPEERVISEECAGANSVCAADVDGDGDVDVLCASQDDDTVGWYESDGAPVPSYTRRILSTEADGACAVCAADVDGDGDTDVLCASQNDDTVAWFESDGGSPPSFAEHGIASSADGASCVCTADVDRDGDVDIISSSRHDDKVAWYESDGGKPPSFTERAVSGTTNAATCVFPADVDSDGDVDILSASYEDDTVAWHESDGGAPPSFTEHAIFTAADGVESVHACDVDGDGHMDVVSASSLDGVIRWYENLGVPSPSFVEHMICATANGAASVFAGDVDEDGDVDVLSASREDDTVSWHESDGGSPPTFVEHVVSAWADGADAVCAADVDGDGDVDALSAASEGGKIAWYPNKGGQSALPTLDTGPFRLAQGETDDILKVFALHRGRAGDAELELAALELLLEESEGDPLTSGEANALIENLYVYMDDGSGIFEPGVDTLVASVETLSLDDGKQVVSFSDEEPLVRLAHGASKAFFVAVELTGNAWSQNPNKFRLTHLTEACSEAEDYEHDIVLTLEFAPNVSYETKAQPRFRVFSSLGEAVAEIDREGSLFLAGTVCGHAAPRASLANEFLVKSPGGAVVMSIDENGNLNLAGSMHKSQAPLTAPEGSFIFKNGAGDVVAYCTSEGDLYLLGEVMHGP